jgi:cysteine synthase
MNTRRIESRRVPTGVRRRSSLVSLTRPPVLFDLIEHEGLVLGGTSAINIVGAMRLARDLGPKSLLAMFSIS